MTLRKDFKFCVYLKNCLAEKLRLLFKFSWTCFLISIFWILLWHIIVEPMKIEQRVKIKFLLIILCYFILFYIILYYFLGSCFISCSNFRINNYLNDICLSNLYLSSSRNSCRKN